MPVCVDGSPRAYSDQLLEDYNAKKYTYNGKKLTEYEASQMQRHHERQIRRWKRENAAMQAAGQDTAESAAKIRSWQERQKDFIRQTGLKLCRQFHPHRPAPVPYPVELIKSGYFGCLPERLNIFPCQTACSGLAPACAVVSTRSQPSSSASSHCSCAAV